MTKKSIFVKILESQGSPMSIEQLTIAEALATRDKNKTKNTMMVLLSKLYKQGAIIRVEKGIYGLPSWDSKGFLFRSLQNQILDCLAEAQEPLTNKQICQKINEVYSQKFMNTTSSMVRKGKLKKIGCKVYCLPQWQGLNFWSVQVDIGIFNALKKVWVDADGNIIKTKSGDL